MKRPVDWSRDALNDLGEQIAYIAQDHGAAARRGADQISDTAAALGEMATGRPGRVVGVYEKPISGLPYILAYEIAIRGARERLTIVRVIHTARDWPEAGWPE